MIKEIKKLGALELASNIQRALRINPKLHTILWETTLRCNAKCKHCGSFAGENSQEELSTQEIKKVFKDISLRYKPNEILITATGGEPLLRKDVFEVIKYATDLGLRFSMTTNGILINEEIIKKMKEANMQTISISLDGLEKNHDDFRGVLGSYKTIIKNIKMLVESKVLDKIQITTVVNKKNIGELEELYNVIKGLNVDSWRLINIEPIGRAKQNENLFLEKEDYKYLFNFIKEKIKTSSFEVIYGCPHFLGKDMELEVRKHPFFCMAGLTTCSILYNGDVFVCTSVERRKELVQGNVKKNNFCDIWENKFEWVRDTNKFENPKCKNCKDWKYCRGDSLHSWNFEEHKPNICMMEILEK